MDELEVARKYELFIRRATVFFDDGSKVESSYLYSSINSREPFDKIARKLEEVNDYCFHQLVAAEKQFAAALKHLVQAEKSDHQDAADLDVTADDVDISNENLKSVALATPVILLASLLEWALKEVYRSLQGRDPPPKRKPGAKGRNVSDVEHLLGLLSGECGLRFEYASAAMSVLGNVRRIRNRFVHGDWDELGDVLECVSLRAFFQTISSLLKVIDDAHYSAVSSNRA